MATPIRHSLKDISPKAYEHPADRAATAALHSIPKLDQVVRKLIEFQYERAYRQIFLANSVKLGEDQLPEAWERYQLALRTLDVETNADLYVTQWPFANAFTIGSEKPMVVLNSGLVDLLDDDELLTVLAHEVGHILSDHVLYTTALYILLSIGTSGVPFLGLPLVGVRAALLEWQRAAELSSDRAATLVNRDPLVTCRTLMVLAGGNSSRKLNLDAFLRQAQEYHDWDSAYDRMSRFFVNVGRTHSVPVRRVAEIQAWVRSGDYDRIIGGDYATRDHVPDPRAEAGEAVQHYTERFRTIFREAGEQVGRSGHRLADWLRGGKGDAA